MTHGVQAHHVGSAEGAAGGAPHLLAGQVIDHVVGQAEVFHFLHGGQHPSDANAVGNEVGGVFGTHHAFAQVAGDKVFQRVQVLGFGRGGVDQFHQRHVAGWVEEMNTAKAVLDYFGQGLTQLSDRQAGRVGRDNRVRANERRDLFVQLQLPVHALGNRFDDQIATAQLLQMLFVVGLANQIGIFGQTQRCRLEFFQILNGFANDAILGPFFGCQIEQHHGHFDVNQMGRDLRPHHAGTEHGDFSNIKTGHGVS